jgi:hypothetical protein
MGNEPVEKETKGYKLEQQKLFSQIQFSKTQAKRS